MRQKRLLVLLAALLLGILTFIGSTALFQPAIAYAHAYVIGSDPVDGSTVSSFPAKIQIFFNAPISIASNAHVYTIQNNQQIELPINSMSIEHGRQLNLTLKDAANLPIGSYEIIWNALANNDGHSTYGVIGFNVGESSLGLSGTSLLGPTTSNRLDEIRTLDLFGTLSVLWNWFALLALTLWLGVLVSKYVIVAKVSRLEIFSTKLKKPLQSLQWSCLTLLVASELVLLFLRVNSFDHSQYSDTLTIHAIFQMLFETTYGYLWLIRMLLLLLASLLLARSTKKQETIVIPEKTSRPEYRTGSLRTTGPLHTQEPPEIHSTGIANLTKERIEVKRTTTTPAPTRNHPYLWLFLAALLLFTYAFSSETAQLQDTPISATIFEWLGLAAQGIWFGGLAYLAFLLLPILPDIERDPHAETLTLLLQRFTPVLIASLCISLLSAFYQGEASINAPEQLLNDPYGRILLIQAVLFLIVSFLTLYALFMLRTRLTRQALLLPVVNADLPARRTRQTALGQTGQSLKQIVKISVLPAAAILLCSAFMAFYTPPIKFPNITYSNPIQNTTNASATQSKQVGDLLATLQVLPAKTGVDNIVLLTLTDPSGKAVSDAKVLIQTNMVVMDMGVAIKNIEPGRAVYAAAFDKSEAFDMAGQWNVTVKIQRPGQSELQTSFQVNAL